VAAGKLPKTFDPLAIIPEINYVYRFYDDKDRLLYVGITRKPQARFQAHQLKADWWDHAERCTIDVRASRASAFWAEGMAIHHEGPLYNETYVSAVGLEQLRAYAEGRVLAPEFAVYYPELQALIQAHVRADGLEADLVAVRAELAAVTQQVEADKQARIDAAAPYDYEANMWRLQRELELATITAEAATRRAERAEHAERGSRRQWKVADGFEALAAVTKQPLQAAKRCRPTRGR
jgi:predicted GIY-YIG superfamily endonuclease